MKLDIKDLQKVARDMLHDSRFEHSMNVSRESVKLAKMYGVDAKKAQIAGMLHDITKDFSDDDHLKFIEMYDGNVDEVEMHSPKLFHPISGAVYVKKVIGINDEDVLNAIRFHTTGRRSMSLLEKVVYVADWSSVDRKFDGVDEFRSVAYKNIEVAVNKELLSTMKKLIFLEIPIAQNTFLAYNEMSRKNNFK